jgi:polo-like kinase 1
MTDKGANAGDQQFEIIEEKITNALGEPVIKRYARGKFLGKGGFAKCYECTNLETKKVTAAKIIPKATLQKSRQRAKLLSEIKIHRALQHPNVVQFEHVFEDSLNVYILLELCTNQSLNDLIKRRKRLHEIEVQCYIFQIVNSLKYLHQNRIIHRDLKLGNLFLSDKMELKLGDFGLAAKLEFDNEKRHTVCGTPNYIAPEILENKIGHSYEVDVWSLGVVIYTLIIGRPPFETPEVKSTYKKIKMCAYTFPEHIPLSENVKNIVQRILQTDPAKRPSLDEIITHPFINSGQGIPKALPLSTLACPPSKSYLDQYATNSKKPTTKQSMSDLNALDGDDFVSGIKNETQKQGQISRTDDLGGKSGSQNMNKSRQEIYVKKWVDYSTKYGLGYLLSNGSSGVFFNDCTKIILDPSKEYFEYIERRSSDRTDVVVAYNLNSYPKSLHKKVTLLQHFRSYLEGVRTQPSTPVDNAEPLSEKKKPDHLVYLKKWMKTRHAIMFRLSNKIVQVDFQDKTQIILSSESKLVTYVNKKGEKSDYPIATALESDNAEMAKRLKYTKEILTHMLNNNMPNNGGTIAGPE